MKTVHEKYREVYTKEIMDSDLKSLREWAEWFTKRAPQFYGKEYKRWCRLQTYKYYYLAFVPAVQKVVSTEGFVWK